MDKAEERCLLQLFEEAVCSRQWRELEGARKRTQIYTLPVVVGMMVLQRLKERGTQQEAVYQMAVGALQGVLADCKRVREGKISQNSGGYARACKRMQV